MSMNNNWRMAWTSMRKSRRLHCTGVVTLNECLTIPKNVKS